MKKYFLFVIGAILFLGCSAKKEYLLFQDVNKTTKQSQKPIKKSTTKYIYEYKILPGDRLSITVFNHPELSTDNKTDLSGINVFPDGTINLPLVGNVKVAGLTEEQATKKLEKLYSEYLKHPYIKLEVLTKKVYVLGEVKQPGVVQISGNYTTLIEAISQRGGFNDMARRNNILIISGGLNNPQIRQIDLTKISSLNYKNLVLKPNDIVYVQPMNMKPLDVQIQGVSPIVSFVNSILSTFVNVKILSQ